MAQSSDLGGIGPLTIASVPNLPEPFDTVVLTLDAYSMNTRGAEIVWFADNVEIPNSRNQREISYRVGGLGELTTITVLVRNPNTEMVLAQIKKTLSPAKVDLIIEPQTMVPQQYQGAALTSEGSFIKVIAIPQESQFRSPLEYSYVWKLNGEVMALGESLGRNIIGLEISDRNSYITVDIYDRSGRAVAAETMLIPMVEPELHFYIDNPLRGLQEFVAGSVLDLRNDQLTVRAEPYYFPETQRTDEELLIEWEVGGNRIATPNPDPFSITVEKQAERGAVPIEFLLRHLSIDRQFKSLRDSLLIRF